MDASILNKKEGLLSFQAGSHLFFLYHSMNVKSFWLTVIKAVEKEQPWLVAFCEH